MADTFPIDSELNEDLPPKDLPSQMMVSSKGRKRIQTARDAGAHHDSPSPKDVDTPETPPTTKTKLTSAEKRMLRRVEVRSDLDSRHQEGTATLSDEKACNPDPKTPGASSKSLSILDLMNSVSRKDAFTLEWRRTLQKQACTSTTTRPVGTRPQSAAREDPVTPLARQSAASANPGRTQDLATPMMTSSRRTAPTTQYEDLDATFQPDSGLSIKDIHADRSTSVCRMAETKLGPGTPHANYEHLPDWCKPQIKTEVVPSVLEIYGAEDNPWAATTEKQGPLIKILQKLIDNIFPHRHHHLDKKDIIYRWASPALACEQLRSVFMLKVVGSHMSTIIGSVHTTNNPNDLCPVGAVALAAAAIEHVFIYYSCDQQKGIPIKKFSVKHGVGFDTGKWQDDAVADLPTRPQ
ncbi:hypothetical protein C8Q76DRAFT_792287 [Earliella scabrosa]|nr:hypothetical protein C8Q76DRAFT_792287 [Earliella scabrosa]